MFSTSKLLISISSLSILFTGWLLLAYPQSERQEEELASEFAPGKFVSSEICGACHQAIYRMWNENSIHARAVTAPLFKIAFQQAIQARGESIRKVCLSCHSPTTMVTKDYSLATRLSQEGVTCDFCHSVKAVQFEQRKASESPFTLDVGLVKRGPLADAQPKIHKAAYSELHTDSLFCAGCHEYTNEKGGHVLSTYTEWKAGPYPAQKFHCQTCHMQIYFADLVADPVSHKLNRKLINLHHTPGGHFPEQLQRALVVQITDIVRAHDRMTINVKVTNQAGHAVPTGLPTKKMVLRVDAKPDDGGKSHQSERVYQRVMVNEKGEELNNETQLFLDAKRVRRDTRLKPGESRLEKFTFPITPGTKVLVSVQLTYSATHGDYHPEEITQVYSIEQTSE
jgi:hypothetical protein